ncbi:MAG: transcriptional regulator PpsR [Caulobacterales bacterium]|jgi:transcriptional regulator PpsR
MQVASPATVAFNRPAETLGSLTPEVAAKVLAAAGDVAIILDGQGVIRDLAVSDATMVEDGFADWVNKPWIDTVLPDSRPKVEQMLDEVRAQDGGRWREINHITSSGPIPIRYRAIDAGADGRVIAIGRDLRPAAAMQQRLLQAQQAMERDYLRLRHAELRYRQLFQTATEGVVIVDAGSRRVIDVNPAALRLIGDDSDGVVGQIFTGLMEAPMRDPATSLLANVQAGGRAEPTRVRFLSSPGRDLVLSASLFRQDRTAQFIVRLTSPAMPGVALPDPRLRFIDVLERMPDAFVVTSDDFIISACNAAFLDLVQLAGPEQARGQPLARYLGRPGVDVSLLMAQLREHGVVRGFATVLRTSLDTEEEAEVSAVTVQDGAPPAIGFAIRPVGRRMRDRSELGRSLPRSVEQLTELVGRVSLKEIVRETTDLIERLCIEAALNITGDNRASAAEVLGLSRQSLYSKLHRYGLGNLAVDQD